LILKNITLKETFLNIDVHQYVMSTEPNWKGIPRNEITWHPIVDKDKCVGCGMCITSCRKGVYTFDLKNNKAIVAHPEKCMVGCTSCETWCIFDAISFPDKQDIKNLIKEKKVLETAKKQLKEKINKCQSCGANCCGSR